MKKNHVFGRRRAPRTDATRSFQLLAAFDRRGLSAAGFARQQGGGLIRLAANTRFFA